MWVSAFILVPKDTKIKKIMKFSAVLQSAGENSKSKKQLLKTTRIIIIRGPRR